jgi:hypothetical protein
MTEDTGILRETGLQYFGLITSSVSHELKNVLAILNENAGLIQDLILMAQKGSPLNVERLGSVAGRFAAQIGRADGILKDLNRFAHTVDSNAAVETDICEALRLSVVLTHRFSSTRGVDVDLDSLPSSVLSTTLPFYLNHLIWLCLDYAMDAAGEPKRVVVTCHQSDTNVSIFFTELNGDMEVTGNPLFSDAGTRLTEMLNARLNIVPEDRCLTITL